MRCAPISIFAFFVAILVTDPPAEAADLNKCKSQDGKVTFQDSPCPAELEEQTRQRREAAARFDERLKDQSKIKSDAPNRAPHKEWLKQEGQSGSAINVQKVGVCKVALSKTNANSPSDYTFAEMSSNQLSFTSTRGYRYRCEIDGLAIKLSSANWGRIQPTGNMTIEGQCVRFTLYDPGLMTTHDGSYCSQ